MTTITNLASSISAVVDEQTPVDATNTDFSKAFDKVDH